MILPKTQSGFYFYLKEVERKLFRKGQARIICKNSRSGDFHVGLA